MSFKIIYGDICEMKVDSIVNSLGTNIKILGGICKDILSKSKSREIYDLVNTDKKVNVFDIFVTGAGELNTNHVIHIVSPYKMDDDENLSLLKNAYDLVIKEAIKRKYKSIAIPFLGTGANGYNRLDVYQAATEVGKKYTEDDTNQDIEIILTIYNKKAEKERRLIDSRRRPSNIMGNICGLDDLEDILDERCCEVEEFKSNIVSNKSYMQKNVMASMTMNGIFSLMDFDEMCNPEGAIKTPFNLVEEYMSQHDIDQKYFYAEAYDKDYASKLRTGARKLQKYALYRIAIVLALPRTVFLQLMSFAGFSFSPIDKLDVWFYNYYLENNIEPDQGHFIDKYYDELPEVNKIFKA